MSVAKLSSVSRERCLFFISFMAGKDCSHLYVEPNRQTYIFVQMNVSVETSQQEACARTESCLLNSARLELP